MTFLVIVKRDEPGLFTYLQQHFQEPEISVLMDRRLGERRQRVIPVPLERRRGDRRTIRSEEDPLWKYGFRVAVTQEVATPP